MKSYHIYPNTFIQLFGLKSNEKVIEIHRNYSIIECIAA